MGAGDSHDERIAATVNLSDLTPRELANAVTPLFLLDHRYQREALEELVRRCEEAKTDA